MEKNEVKKLLYRVKPTAVLENDKDPKVYVYASTFKDGQEEYSLTFTVPVTDMGDAKFKETMEAHLLIRWMNSWSKM
jgi:hypothetical protein